MIGIRLGHPAIGSGGTLVETALGAWNREGRQIRHLELVEYLLIEIALHRRADHDPSGIGVAVFRQAHRLATRVGVLVQQQDLQAAFGQESRARAAAKAGADDDHVV